MDITHSALTFTIRCLSCASSASVACTSAWECSGCTTSSLARSSTSAGTLHTFVCRYCSHLSRLAVSEPVTAFSTACSHSPVAASPSSSLPSAAALSLFLARFISSSNVSNVALTTSSQNNVTSGSTLHTTGTAAAAALDTRCFLLLADEDVAGLRTGGSGDSERLRDVELLGCLVDVGVSCERRRGDLRSSFTDSCSALTESAALSSADSACCCCCRRCCPSCSSSASRLFFLLPLVASVFLAVVAGGCRVDRCARLVGVVAVLLLAVLLDSVAGADCLRVARRTADTLCKDCLSSSGPDPASSSSSSSSSTFSSSSASSTSSSSTVAATVAVSCSRSPSSPPPSSSSAASFRSCWSLLCCCCFLTALLGVVVAVLSAAGCVVRVERGVLLAAAAGRVRSGCAELTVVGLGPDERREERARLGAVLGVLGAFVVAVFPVLGRFRPLILTEAGNKGHKETVAGEEADARHDQLLNALAMLLHDIKRATLPWYC